MCVCVYLEVAVVFGGLLVLSSKKPSHFSLCPPEGRGCIQSLGRDQTWTQGSDVQGQMGMGLLEE